MNKRNTTDTKVEVKERQRELAVPLRLPQIRKKESVDWEIGPLKANKRDWTWQEKEARSQGWFAELPIKTIDWRHRCILKIKEKPDYTDRGSVHERLRPGLESIWNQNDGLVAGTERRKVETWSYREVATKINSLLIGQSRVVSHSDTSLYQHVSVNRTES